MTQLTLTVKKFSTRGLYIYLPKKYFHIGQEIQFEVDEDLIKGVGEQNKIELNTITSEITEKVLKNLRQELIAFQARIKADLIKQIPQYSDLVKLSQKIDAMKAAELDR